MLARAGSLQIETSERTLLDARDLWFSYSRRAPVLQGVDLSVQAGEIAMILGRSGSGKTTLIKIIKGLLRPDRGTVHLLVPENGRAPAAKIAYIPQSLGLVRNTTALENTLTGALARTPLARSMVKSFPGDTVDEARQTLISLGLGDKIEKPVFELSGGQRQRVAIARALMQHPRLILADEFVSQLDHVTAEEILGLMHEIAGTGVGMLITTHEIDVVMNHADRLLIMQGGRIVHDKPPALVSAEDLVALLG
jgi:ABC-type phosphate/phosphonate transport system ATPase subunit